jgi:hypothetical protein
VDNWRDFLANPVNLFSGMPELIRVSFFAEETRRQKFFIVPRLIEATFSFVAAQKS